MKGIETGVAARFGFRARTRSDHCPAMKGIETCFAVRLSTTTSS